MNIKKCILLFTAAIAMNFGMSFATTERRAESMKQLQTLLNERGLTEQEIEAAQKEFSVLRSFPEVQQKINALAEDYWLKGGINIFDMDKMVVLNNIAVQNAMNKSRKNCLMMEENSVSFCGNVMVIVDILLEMDILKQADLLEQEKAASNN